MSVIYSENEPNSPSAASRYSRAKRQRRGDYSSASKMHLSGKDAINIETKTLTKQINITWSISKQTIDVAKLSLKGEKKGVIETSVKYHEHTFNLELCVPGWRRSQDGFSAFYLTVPRKTRSEKQRIWCNRLRLQRQHQSHAHRNNNNDDDDTDRDENEERDEDEDAVHDDQLDHDRNSNNNNNSNSSNNNNNMSHDEEEDNDFVARYSVSFGDAEQRVTRKSSIRNDFDLGVGFPNFTEVSTLIDAIYSNSLDFLIEVEIFECESTIRDRPFTNHAQRNAKNISCRLVEKMYHERLHCDAVIVANYANKHNAIKSRHIRVHKCILTAASPVFHSCFKHESKESLTSSIMMTQWNVNTILTMLKFLYLGKIQLFHAELDTLDQDIDEHDADGAQPLGLDAETEQEQETDLESESDAADLLGLDSKHHDGDADVDDDEDAMDMDVDVEVNQAERAQRHLSRSETAPEFERKDEDIDDDNDANNDLYEEVKCAEDTAETSSSCSKLQTRSNRKLARDLELANLESQCPETARRLFAVFQIAECYEIKDLSIACCYKLVSNIATHTCCIFLIYLDKYTHLDAKMREIKSYILDYIVSNIHKVKKTNGYLYLLQNKPELLGELIVKITENVRN